MRNVDMYERLNVTLAASQMGRRQCILPSIWKEADKRAQAVVIAESTLPKGTEFRELWKVIDFQDTVEIK